MPVGMVSTPHRRYSTSLSLAIHLTLCEASEYAEWNNGWRAADNYEPPNEPSDYGRFEDSPRYRSAMIDAGRARRICSDDAPSAQVRFHAYLDWCKQDYPPITAPTSTHLSAPRYGAAMSSIKPTARPHTMSVPFSIRWHLRPCAPLEETVR